MRHVTLMMVLAAVGLGFAQEAELVEGWPRAYESKEGDRLVVYQPQIEEWDEFETMTAVAAAKVTPKDGAGPVYGAIHLRAQTKTNLVVRMVTFSNITLEEIRFPNLDEAESAKCEAIIRRLVTPKSSIPMALDRVVAALERS